jgi:hypothetical protein
MNRDTTMPRVAALAVLRLQAGATRDEVKAAYRAAVKRTHPDAGGTAGAFYIPAGQFRLGGNYKCHVTLKGWDFINHRERTEGDKKP